VTRGDLVQVEKRYCLGPTGRDNPTLSPVNDRNDDRQGSREGVIENARSAADGCSRQVLTRLAVSRQTRPLPAALIGQFRAGMCQYLLVVKRLSTTSASGRFSRWLVRRTV
jgi:hypothetical protein